MLVSMDKASACFYTYYIIFMLSRFLWLFRCSTCHAWLPTERHNACSFDQRSLLPYQKTCELPTQSRLGAHVLRRRYKIWVTCPHILRYVLSKNNPRNKWISNQFGYFFRSNFMNKIFCLNIALLTDKTQEHKHLESNNICHLIFHDGFGNFFNNICSTAINSFASNQPLIIFYP